MIQCNSHKYYCLHKTFRESLMLIVLVYLLISQSMVFAAVSENETHLEIINVDQVAT